MANTDASQGRSRKGGSNWIPMLVAFIATAGFMVWLAMREPQESVAVVEPGDTADATTEVPAGPAQPIEPEVLTQTASTRELIGRDGELASVRVSDVLGSTMFCIELPGGAPYLVRLEDEAAPLPQPQTNVTVTGRVLEKDAAMLDAWTASDSLNADQRMLAEFGSTFIQARRVGPAGR